MINEFMNSTDLYRSHSWISQQATLMKLMNLSGYYSDISLNKFMLMQAEIFNNWSTTDPPWKYDILKMPSVRIVIIVVYVIIISIGVITNGIVIFVGLRCRRSQRHQLPVTCIFVVVLAASDFCLCVFSLPVQLHYQLTEQWSLGQTMCRLVFSAFALPMYISAITILLIAIDRYRLIIYPLKHRLSPCLALVLVFLNVIFSLVMSLPVVYYSRLEKINQPDIRMFKILCVERWTDAYARQVYSVSTFCCQYCLPLLLTGYLYVKIFSRLKFRNKLRSVNRKAATSCKSSNEQTGNKSLKTFKILFAIVFNFFICWTPWNVFSLITEMNHSVVNGPFFSLVDIMLKAFAMLSACTNPILYCWLNDQLRQDFQTVIIKLRLTSSKDSSAIQQNKENMKKSQNLPKLTVEPPSCDGSRMAATTCAMATEKLSTYDEQSTFLSGKLFNSSSQ